MQFTIDPRLAADVTQRLVEAMTETLCASTPMLSWHGGPVMVIDAEDCGHKIGWRVAGVISEGKPDYDYIVATRADVIQDDGRITE